MKNASVSIALAAIALVSGCASLSPEQQAYNKCVDAYASEFSALGGAKAMAAGTDSVSRVYCAWVWDGLVQGLANSGALENCRKEVNSCWLFATGEGLTDWALNIAEASGTAPGQRIQESVNAEGLSTFMQGMLLGMTAYTSARSGAGINPFAYSQLLGGSPSYQPPSASPVSLGTTDGRSALDSQCSPLPPNCQRVSDAGIAKLREFPSATGMVDSASTALCAALVGEMVNSFCAQEYRQLGLEQCATASESQALAMARAIPQYEGAVSAVSVSGVRKACVWER